MFELSPQSFIGKEVEQDGFTYVIYDVREVQFANEQIKWSVSTCGGKFTPHEWNDWAENWTLTGN